MTTAPPHYPRPVLRLYDTRLHEVVPIEPVVPDLLRVYACGPTVYKPQHVGNLRSSLLPDLILRLARWHGLTTRFVQNITDVGHLDDASGDDKMITEARARGLSPLEVAREIEGLFHADGRSLGLLPADGNPRATEYVEQMITLTAQLVDGGHAYASGGSVWFDARSFATYGELSGNRLADLEAGASGRLSAREEQAKRFHADWALWRGEEQTGDPDQLLWESPWGTGTPGWHLECSAMSLDLLGAPFDVHTGGIDLRFPHHEDERAQSDAVTGREVVRHWVHGEHLLFDGRKMAKSTGNVVLLSDVVARGLDPLAVRLFFLQAGRYRTQLNLTWAQLEAADRRLRRWRELVRTWADSDSEPIATGYADRVVAALDDDLDSVTAVRVLGELTKDPTVGPGAKFETFAALDRLLGLDLARDVGRPPASLPDGAVALIEEREQARTAESWARADALRAALAALGVSVADTPEGPVATVG